MIQTYCRSRCKEDGKEGQVYFWTWGRAWKLQVLEERKEEEEEEEEDYFIKLKRQGGSPQVELPSCNVHLTFLHFRPETAYSDGDFHDCVESLEENACTITDNYLTEC